MKSNHLRKAFYTIKKRRVGGLVRAERGKKKEANWTRETVNSEKFFGVG